MAKTVDWLKERTFHHSAFSDLAALVRAKEERGLRISLCFPTLNEAATIAKEIVVMRSVVISLSRLRDVIS